MFEKDLNCSIYFVFTLIYDKFPSNNSGQLYYGGHFFNSAHHFDSLLISFHLVQTYHVFENVQDLYRFSKEILNKLNQTFVLFYV